MVLLIHLQIIIYFGYENENLYRQNLLPFVFVEDFFVVRISAQCILWIVTAHDLRINHGTSLKEQDKMTKNSYSSA